MFARKNFRAPWLGEIWKFSRGQIFAHPDFKNFRADLISRTPKRNNFSNFYSSFQWHLNRPPPAEWTGECRQISAKYRQIPADTGRYRHISAHIGTYRRISAHSGNIGRYRLADPWQIESFHPILEEKIDINIQNNCIFWSILYMATSH